jgi:SAM-dependent methyltransferase
MITLDPITQKTQRSNTTATYKKLADKLKDRKIQSINVEGHKILDYGAGKQLGTKVLRDTLKTSEVYSYEPFAGETTPNYSNPDQIPRDEFALVICLNVLNVIKKSFDRQLIIQNIIDSLKVGGCGIIGVRHINNVAPWTKTAESCGDGEFLFPDGRFQKGYTEEILRGELIRFDDRISIHMYPVKGLNTLTFAVCKEF